MVEALLHSAWQYRNIGKIKLQANDKRLLKVTTSNGLNKIVSNDYIEGSLRTGTYKDTKGYKIQWFGKFILMTNTLPLLIV